MSVSDTGRASNFSGAPHWADTRANPLSHSAKCTETTAAHQTCAVSRVCSQRFNRIPLLALALDVPSRNKTEERRRKRERENRTTHHVVDGVDALCFVLFAHDLDLRRCPLVLHATESSTRQRILSRSLGLAVAASWHSVWRARPHAPALLPDTATAHPTLRARCSPSGIEPPASPNSLLPPIARTSPGAPTPHSLQTQTRETTTTVLGRFALKRRRCARVDVGADLLREAPSVLVVGIAKCCVVGIAKCSSGADLLWEAPSVLAAGREPTQVTPRDRTAAALPTPAQLQSPLTTVLTAPFFPLPLLPS
eukprot:2261951-Rhodomonas_salina.1